ncbi:MAG TPA: asparagine--tRNA ligase [Terriglobales bacterium]|nr:asparagine--tRNA ligase [Terriglobales bacterium]
MQRCELVNLVKDPKAYEGKTVTVGGWARTIRDSKTIGFVELNDGSCFKSVQLLLDAGKLNNYKEIVKQNVGAALVAKGTVKLTPEAQQPFEIVAEEVAVEGESSPDYPLQKKKHSLEFLREIAHLRVRTNTYSAVFRLRSVAAKALHDFYQGEGFVYVNTPIITGSDCEGAGEMFRLTTLDIGNPPRLPDGSIDTSKDFFGKETNLTVSGQLEAECFALAFGKVYTFGPTFRAENSNTARHAAEFWMNEPEIAFAELSDNMALAERMIKYVIREVLEKCPDEMAFFNEYYDKGLIERLTALMNAEFKHITYTDAVAKLEGHKDEFEYPVYWGCDLQTEHERYLTEKIFGGPVFVINYPKEIKAFYMRLNDDGKTVAAMDLLVPGVGEIIGGSQREERIDVLESRIKEMKLSLQDYWWYLELRKYGGTKHAGYGLGFERLVMYLTGVGNIRDVIPFPRTVGKADF